MTRVGKKEERRNRSPRRPKIAGIKTGAKKDNLPKGFKEHENMFSGGAFVPKVKGV